MNINHHHHDYSQQSSFQSFQQHPLTSFTSQYYKQLQPPKLFKFMTLKHSQNDISLQFWNHLVDFKSINLPTTQQSQYINFKILFAKDKNGGIAFWQFDKFAGLLTQRNLKIQHATKVQITTIKCFEIGETDENHQSFRGQQAIIYNPIALLFLGYFDGIVEIYNILISRKTGCLILERQLIIQTKFKSPVTDIQTNKEDLFIVRGHNVCRYPKIITQIYNKKQTKENKQTTTDNNININNTSNNNKYKYKESLLQIQQLEKSSSSLKLSISSNNKILHIYNEFEGVFSLDLPTMQRISSIIDSAKFCIQNIFQDLIISSADDTINIIYSSSNGNDLQKKNSISQIQKINGFKCFVSYICQNYRDCENKKNLIKKQSNNNNQKNNQKNKNKKNIIKQTKKIISSQLWLFDMNGCLHYLVKRFIKNINNQTHDDGQGSQQNKEQQGLHMFNSNLTKGINISENGIKKAFVLQTQNNNSILLIVDCQMNIVLFDILRQQHLNTQESEEQSAMDSRFVLIDQ